MPPCLPHTSVHFCHYPTGRPHTSPQSASPPVSASPSSLSVHPCLDPILYCPVVTKDYISSLINLSNITQIFKKHIYTVYQFLFTNICDNKALTNSCKIIAVGFLSIEYGIQGYCSKFAF